MKVGGIKGGVTRAGSTRKSSSSRSSKSVGSVSSFGNKDQVEVSDHSQTLDLIRDLVEASPDVRVDEVDRVMNQLKKGKYKVNFEKVAEGFIKEAIANAMARRRQGKV